MPKIGLIATSVALLVVSIVIVCSVGSSLTLVAFGAVSLIPLALTFVAASALPKPSSQLALTSGAILYSAWIMLCAVYSFAIKPGSLSPLVFVMGPIYSLPVWLLIWCIAIYKQLSNGAGFDPQEHSR